MVISENAPVQIERDPFARHSIMRSRVYVSAGHTCEWCGGQRAVRRVGDILVRPYLYRFGVDRDGMYNTLSMQDRLFCSRVCMETFNG